MDKFMTQKYDILKSIFEVEGISEIFKLTPPY